MNHLHSFPLGQMVKSMDFRSDGDCACRFNSRHGRFFLNDDGLMMIFFYDGKRAQSASVDASAKHKARGSEATENTSAKPEGTKRSRMRITRPEGAKRTLMRAQSLREQGDRVSVPEWAQRIYALAYQRVDMVEALWHLDLIYKKMIRPSNQLKLRYNSWGQHLRHIPQAFRALSPLVGDRSLRYRPDAFFVPCKYEWKRSNSKAWFSDNL